MKWLAIIVPVFLLIAGAVYYSTTGDKRVAFDNAGPKQQILTIVLGGETAQELIAAGHYDRVDPPFLLSVLPARPSERTEVELTLLKLVDFSSKEQAVAALKEKGLVPASMEHLLSLGAQQPQFHVYNNGSLIFLGTTLQDAENEESVPALSTNDPHELRLYHATDPLLIGPDDWVAGVKR
jgi:hypothetical protein